MTVTASRPASGSELSLSGRRALVTGAASGIGLAIARRLASRGAEVLLADLAGAPLDDAAAGIDGATPLTADLADRDAVRGLVAAAGDVDILVNNAGFQRVAPVEDFVEQDWDRLIEVMLTAPFLLSRAVLPGMYGRGWGRIVNVASVHGLVASKYKAGYVSAKHALVGLTKVIALEAADRCRDVTAHSVCPSYVRTPLVEGQVADQARAHGISAEEVLEDVMLTRNAVKRLIEPDDVAAAVEMLCGEAAWSMTGSALTLDAGWLAH